MPVCLLRPSRLYAGQPLSGAFKRSRLFTRWILASALVASIPLHLAAQVLPFRHFTRENGLIANDVTTLFQDSLKFLWIGTANGITRFDGTEFSSYTTADGLPSNFVSDVEESQGWLWVATFDGLCRTRAHEAGTERVFEKFASGPMSDARKVFALLDDRDSSIWCATDIGLFRIRGAAVTEVVHQGDRIRAHALARSADGAVWMDNDGDLLLYDPILSETRQPAAPRHGTPISIADDGTGSVWIAARDSTILRFRNGVFQSSRKLHSAIRSVQTDHAGNILLSTSGGLLSIPSDRFDNGEFLRYGQEQGLLSSNIEFSLVDHENGLWIAQRERGVSLLAERNFWIYPLTGIPETTNNGRAATDRHGHFWAASSNGLEEVWKTPHGSWKQQTHSHGGAWSRGEVISLRRSPAGHLWVHTRARVYEARVEARAAGPSTLRIARSSSTALDAHRKTAMFMLVAADGTIWLSYPGHGVAHVDPSGGERTRIFTAREGLPSDDIRALFEDRTGTIWFGGYASGIAVLPRGASAALPLTGSSRLEPGQQLPDNMIRAIEEDRQGRIWVGTRYQGIAVIDRGRVRSITTENGLINNSVWAFAEDSVSSMWVATAFGLQQVSLATLEPVPTRESLLGKPVASLGLGADGYAWFTTPEALRVFRYQAEDRSTPPPVYITRLAANTIPLTAQGSIELPADRNNFEVGFAGVSFLPLRGMTYQYRLRGADDRWGEATGARTAQFLALEPGSYTFEVRAATSVSDRRDAVARQTITILQPIWRRWWFIASSLVALMAAGFALLRMRERRLLTIERMRSRIARDLHDEIGSNLTGIAMSSQLILGQKHLGSVARSRLSEIRTTAQHTSELMRDIVWLINPGNDTLDELLLWMKTTAFSILGPIDHSFSSPPDVPHTSMDLSVKRSLFLIYKEALTNIAKHSKASTVRIVVVLIDGTISIRIEDNGVGIPDASSSRGNGLRNMRVRATEIGGAFEAVPAKDRGTVVSIRARITQTRNGLSR